MHLLQAIKFLYEFGFYTLGHIHTGNIFLEEAQTAEGGSRVTCKLGGCSETLLGYRTRLNVDIIQRNLLKHIDVILFGKMQVPSFSVSHSSQPLAILMSVNPDHE